MGLYFAIKLTERDRRLLVEIQAFFGGMGSIYRVKPRRAPTQASGMTKQAAYYRVSRKDQLPRVVEHFDRYPLRGTKADSYAIWREMVAIRCASPHPRWDELERLASELSVASPRNQAWSP